MASVSQHRSVFVGNIPYDLREEEVRQICEEVGPVVSFNLVTDKETGKPKGFGFCEYRDEETALSARRNLQGYQINGRQLRVDFADPRHKSGNSSDKKQIGIDAAVAAGSLMAGALGLGQSAVVGDDPLNLHLARMSRYQLTQVLSEIAALDRDLVRELLLARPHFAKALLQVTIMLGMVPPQALSNLQQISVSASQNVPQQQQVSPQPQFASAGAQIPFHTSHFRQIQQHPVQSGVTSMISQQLLASSVTPQNHIAVVPSPTTPQMPMAHNLTQIRSSQLGPESHSNLHTSFYARPWVVGHQHGPISQGTLQANGQEDGRGVPGPAPDVGRPLKRVKMEGTNFPPSQTATNQNPIEQQTPQLQPGIDPRLLDQVLKLTPQQLSLLPHDQQQQVIQIQKMLTNSA
uniref:RRM domain-containing protein n=1 Tax=Kalanchoe fedtschenkoi TaxID=63787 RepID=A0A7N0ZQY0_KALFE